MRLAGIALVAFVCLVLLQATTPGGARGMALGAPEVNAIVVREAALRRTPSAWRLDARVDFELPPEVRTGLDSGVPLEFVLELTLREPRRLRPDRVLLDIERRYGLVYYELTRHYRVRSLDDGTARNYRSLTTALEGLGTLAGVSLGSLDVSAPGGPAERDGALAPPLAARLAVRLDHRALPLPLQSPFDATWRLASSPLIWTLRADGTVPEPPPFPESERPS